MTTLTKKVNGVEVPLSQEEINEYNARVDEHESGLLGKAKQKKCSEINTARDNKNIKPILHNTNGEDKYLTIDILDWNTHALAMNDTETIDWICTDNTTIQLNRADILSLCNHIRNRRTNSFIAGRLQKDEVLALSTIEEVEAYNVVI